LNTIDQESDQKYITNEKTSKIDLPDETEFDDSIQKIFKN